MAPTVGQNNGKFTGEYKLINGQYKPVYEDAQGKKYAWVDGKRYDISGSLWCADFYEGLLEKKQAEIATLEDLKYNLNKENNVNKKDLHTFMTNLGAKKVSDITDYWQREKADNLDNEITANNSEITTLKNRIFSGCLRAFEFACDIRKFN